MSENKTKVDAEEGKQFILITREFDLPVHLLFKAYAESELIEQWMENKVLKLESRKHGSYQFQKTDPQGNVVFAAQGTIHEFIPDQKITRTFEMENAPFGVQLEFLEFENITDNTCLLKIRTVFETVEQRDQLLKLPFSFGLNMAHNRLETIAKNTLITKS